MRASVSGITQSPMTFSATAVSGNAARLGRIGSDGAVGAVGTAVTPYSVYAADAHGNAVAGAGVTWMVRSGGGAITPSRVATGAPLWRDGAWRATATATHTLGLVEGQHAAIATLDDAPGLEPVEFRSRAVSAIVRLEVADAITCYYFGHCDEVYLPHTVSVSVGRTVMWSWTGTAGHDLVFEDDPAPPASSPLQQTGAHFRTFTSPGTYRYRCSIHSTGFTQGEVGRVVVQ